MYNIKSPQLSYSNPQTYLILISFTILIATRWFKSPFNLISIRKIDSILLVLGLIILSNGLTPEQALHSVFTQTLLVWLAIKVILSKLENQNLVKYIENILLFRPGSASSLLLRVCILSGVLAPILTDEGCSLFLSTTVLDICNRYNLPFEPFALAIVTSANLGSGALLLGNIKSLLGTEGESKANFVEFARNMTSLVLVGLIFNTIFLYFNFHEQLRNIDLKHFLPKNLSPQLLAEETERELDMDLMRVRQEYMDSKNIPYIDEDQIETALDSNILSNQHIPRERGIYIRNKSHDQPNSNKPQLRIPILSIQVSSPIPTPPAPNLPTPEYCPEFTESPPDFPTFTDFENDQTEPKPSPEQDEHSPAQSFDEYHNIEETYITRSHDASQMSAEIAPLSINTSLPPPAPFLTIPTHPPSNDNSYRCLSNYSVSSAYTIPTPTDGALVTPYNQQTNYFTFHSPSVHEEIVSSEDQPLARCNKLYSILSDPWFGKALISISLVGIYIGILSGLDIGWTCFTGAIIVSFIDNTYSNQGISDSLPCFDNINWYWLTYLLSIFPLVASVQNTPLPHQIWDKVTAFILTKNQIMTNPITGYFLFVGLITLSSILITPIPTLLIFNPLIRKLPLPYSNHFDYLLIWSTIVLSNLTPKTSLSGILVKEMYKTTVINQSWNNFMSIQGLGDNQNDLHMLKNEHLNQLWIRYSIVFTPLLLVISVVFYWITFG